MRKTQVLDLNFMGRKGTIASFLIKSKDGAILIETGPASTLPTLIKKLKAHKVKPEDVKHVFISHVHLDHAGAAWFFAELGATIYVHPKGKKHMSNPEKLWNSAKRIYGNQMETLWGEMKPISPKQLQVVPHKKRVKAGEFKVRALHTPGHASHHVAWEIEDVLFAGDVAGVKMGNGPVMPPCPPPDIDIAAWKKSIDIILKKRYSLIYLTHYGKVNNVRPHLIELRGRLLNWETWMYPYYEQGVAQEKVLPEFVNYVKKQLTQAGVSKSDIASYELANPSWMSVAGLYRYFKKFRT